MTESTTEDLASRNQNRAGSAMPEELRFRSGEEQCAATLYRPDAPVGAAVPCVVMANGYTQTRRDGIPHFAERFAEAGLAALAFDFRHLGDSGGEPRQLVDDRRQRADFAAAIGFARTLEGIDPDRIAAWGFSLGGGAAIYAAAADDRLAAAVTLCPFADGLAFVMAGSLRWNARLTFAALRDLLGRRTVRVPAAGPPSSSAVLNQPEALPGFEAMRAESSLWRNEACARPLLRAGLVRPARVARRVRCPLMVSLGEHDTVVPARPILRVAERAPRGDLRRYPIGHFDAFKSDEVRERVLADQVAFLARHLMPGASALPPSGQPPLSYPRSTRSAT